jgi:predicted  nucleic acid-binding Zn-ribbon protein
MADPQERLQKIASKFGDSEISIFYKRDKVYPDKSVSQKTVDKIESALRSPEGEQSSLRVTQGKAVLYRSYQGAVTEDVKGVAADFQTALKSPEQAPTQAQKGGEIVLVTQSKTLIPIEPTLQQINEKMPEVLSPQPDAVAKPEPVAANPNESLEKALAAANSRLDALQTQLSSTQGALEDLSKHIKESNLKTWATNTAQKVGNTVQTIAVQSKTKVVDWVTQAKATVEQKATQVKIAAQTTVGNVKTAVQDKVESVKTAAQLKTIEVRETARHRISEVLSPVDSAALTATANRVISEWGKDGKFEGNAFNFQRSQSGDVSIHTKDGAAVFVNGVVTDKASPQTIAHLSQLPRRMGVVENHAPTQAPSVKQAFAR